MLQITVMREDIARILQALFVVNESALSLLGDLTAEEDAETARKITAAYRRGYDAALAGVGTAFDLIEREKRQGATLLRLPLAG